MLVGSLTLANFSGWPNLFSSPAFPDAGTGTGSDHVSDTPCAGWSSGPLRCGGAAAAAACLVPDLWAVPPLK